MKVVDNVGWLFFDKILRIGVGLLVGVWVARYLGPEQFGLLSFALAFTGLFGAIATLGLQGIVVRDIVRDPANARLTLGTAAVLQLVSGLLSFLLILTAIAWFRPDDVLARSIVAILGAMMLFKASDIALYWFESQVQSKYIVWVQNAVFLLFAVVKLSLILQQASLTAFVWAMFAEAALVAAILLIVLGYLGPKLSQLQASLVRARTLIKDSWPLILSAMAVSIYMKIDQIMLGEMIGDEAVGIYSAAVRVSEAWYFIPMAIVASVFPAILEAKNHDEEQYYGRLQNLYDLMALISVSVALPMTFLATPLVRLLFGSAFEEAGMVLAIHIWGSVFIFLGVASSKWFLVENLTKLNMIRTICGAAINVILNLVFIPLFSSAGAAGATVLSFIFSVYIIDALNPVTRKLFYMKSNALNYPCAFKRCLRKGLKQSSPKKPGDWQ